MKILRWTLVVPAAIAAWYATLFIGMLAYSTIENSMCPKGEMISGMCTSATVQRVLDGVLVVFVAVSAVLVVSTAVAVAPTHKGIIAWVVFVAGGVLASYCAVATELYAAGVAALAFGFSTVVVIAKRHKTTMA